SKSTNLIVLRTCEGAHTNLIRFVEKQITPLIRNASRKIRTPENKRIRLAVGIIIRATKGIGLVSAGISISATMLVCG
ncbi:MAG: hypothetical protein WA874_19875, partial [Chryseosolibacter sp.]